MCNLGSLLLTGAPGLDKDEKAGFELVHAAAERGHAPAQFNLALCLGAYIYIHTSLYVYIYIHIFLVQLGFMPRCA